MPEYEVQLCASLCVSTLTCAFMWKTQDSKLHLQEAPPQFVKLELTE